MIDFGFDDIWHGDWHIGGVRKAYAKPYIGNPHNVCVGSKSRNYLGGDMASRWRWLLVTKIVVVYYWRRWRGCR